MVMLEAPFVSIIMPVYNCEKDIKKAIESIQAQTLKEWELIIVDDCSTDGTVAEIKKYVQIDNRISLIQKEENKGPGNSRNLGIRRAKGQYVTFFDGDDWIEKDAYQIMTNNGKLQDDVIVSGYYRDIYNLEGKLLDSNLVKSHSFACKENFEVISSIPQMDEERLFSFAWNKLYKKKIIDEYNICFSDKKFGEDFDFNIAFFRYAETVKVLKRGFYHYIKKDTDSLTERYVPDFFEINKNRFLKMKELMTAKENYAGTVRESIMNAYIRHVLVAMSRLYDPRSGNSYVDCRKKISEMLKDDLSKEALKFSKANSKKEKICNMIFKTQNITINMLFARILWFMQTKGKKVYERVK